MQIIHKTLSFHTSLIVLLYIDMIPIRINFKLISNEGVYTIHVCIYALFFMYFKTDAPNFRLFCCCWKGLFLEMVPFQHNWYIALIDLTSFLFMPFFIFLTLTFEQINQSLRIVSIMLRRRELIYAFKIVFVSHTISFNRDTLKIYIVP